MRRFFFTIIIVCSSHLFINAQVLDSLFKDVTSYNQVDSILKNNKKLDIGKREKKEFLRWQKYWRTRVDGSGEFNAIQDGLKNYNLAINYEGSAIKTENSKYKGSATKSAINFYYECLGPSTRPTDLNENDNRSIGRSRIWSLWVDPSDYSHILIGSHMGGLWETQNDGQNWNCITDNSGEIIAGVIDILVDPDDSENIYIVSQVSAAGGSSIFRKTGSYTLGVFWSSDGGSSWNQFNFPNVPVDDLIHEIEMNQLKHLFAVTDNAIYKSTDNGINWSSLTIPTLGSNEYLTDIEIDPDNDNVIYISGKNCLFVSTNGGQSWGLNIKNSISYLSGKSVYTDISILDSTPNEVYVIFHIIENNSTSACIAHSANNGTTWYTPGIIPSFGQLIGIISLNVPPNGDIYAGGYYLRRSVDGGNTFSGTLGGADNLHADIRDIIIPNNGTGNIVFLVNDGGVYKSTNYGSNWDNITGDLVTNTFYNVGITPQDNRLIIGGTHDCGTYYRKEDEKWYFIGGGDGGTSFISPYDPDYYYYTVSHDFYRHNPDGTNTTIIGSSFDAPYGFIVYMDPSDPDVIYYNDANYNLIKGDYTPPLVVDNPGIALFDMSFLESNPSIGYYTAWSSGEGIIRKTTNGGNSWTNCGYTGINELVSGNTVLKDYIPATNVYVERDNSNNVWIAFGGFLSSKKVYKSTNGGSSWTNHTHTGLPDLPIQSFAYDEDNDILFAGTDVGLYWKSYYAYEWDKLQDIPNTIISDLQINPLSNELFISTYGRGMWKIDLDRTFCLTGPTKISSTINWNSDNEFCDDIIIQSGGKLTITGITELGFNTILTIENGGELVVDGGEVKYGNIFVNSGGKIKLKNGGKVDLHHSDDTFKVKSGGLMEYNSGEISIE